MAPAMSPMTAFDELVRTEAAVFARSRCLVTDLFSPGMKSASATLLKVLEVKGKVESVGLRVTTVRDRRGTLWYLRNGEILKVGNSSQRSRS
ncbi:MAG: hypothetical protein EBX82_01455 [Actinobacteria bacterium]|nr:hypothetical protein [Actinomycetota bacterium]